MQCQLTSCGIYDIIYLDIEMKHKNGIIVAHELRQLGSKSLLIYVTSHESFAKEGTGISSKGPAGRPKAYVAFDTQCRDCWQLHRKLASFMDKIEFVFCPISFMNIHSEPQATTILIDKDPLAKLEEHFAHFTDIEFQGIRYGLVEKLPVEVRDKVWTNTKLHRRSGCRAVPYGVFKNSKGQYLPFDERLTVEELKQLFEL